MNNKVEELVEWVATELWERDKHHTYAYPDKRWFDTAGLILSHPNLALIDRETCRTCRGKGEVPCGSSSVDLGYQECRNCRGAGEIIARVTPLAEALKEVKE